MKKLSPLSFVAAGLLGAAAVPALHWAVGASAETGGADALAQAQAALDAGDLHGARDAQAQAIAANRTAPALRLAQVATLLRLSDWKAAQAELDILARLGLKADQLRPLRAQAWLQRGEPQTALKELAGGGYPAAQASLVLRVGASARAAIGDPAADALFARLLQSHGTDWQNWVAFARYRQGVADRGGAIVAMDRALALAPHAVDAVTLRAMLVREQYGLVQALPWFDRALALDGRYAPALVEKAATLADLGRGAEARTALAAVREAGELPGRVAYVDAVLAAREGDDAAARRFLAAVDPATRDSAGALLLGATLDLRKGEPLAAARQLDRLLARQPLNLMVRTLLARAWLEGGQGAMAYQVIAPMTDRPDADSYALLLAARALESAGDQKAALPFLARASRFATGQRPAFALGASAAETAAARSPVAPLRDLLMAGQGGAAIAQAQALAAANPGAPQAFIALGDLLVLSGRNAEAAQAFQRAANLRFDEPVALRLVDAALRAGQVPDARKTVDLYLAQNPRSLALNRAAGGMALGARDWTRAIARFEAARTAGGDGDADLLGDLAQAYRGAGQADKALPLARRAYALAPSSAELAHTYAIVLVSAGDRGPAAVDLLEKAVALAPDVPGYRNALNAVRQARAG